MAAAMKKCKVCGCEYEYCHTARRISGVFRWQDVACCAEHGSIYLAKIEASRSGIIDSNKSDINNAELKNIANPIDDETDYNELFEEDFDDDESEETEIIK